MYRASAGCHNFSPFLTSAAEIAEETCLGGIMARVWSMDTGHWRRIVAAGCAEETADVEIVAIPRVDARFIGVCSYADQVRRAVMQRQQRQHQSL